MLPTVSGRGDLDSLRRVVDLVVAAGVDGVTVLGVTGEVARIAERERRVVAEAVITQVNGRAKVIVGASADGVRTCIELTREAKALGASAVMVSPPRALKLNTESVVNHYKALADAVDLPIVVQDYPPISGFSRWSRRCWRASRARRPSARTIKLEDPPRPIRRRRFLRRRGDARRDSRRLGGDVFLLEELLAGRGGRDDRVRAFRKCWSRSSLCAAGRLTKRRCSIDSSR